MGKLFKGLIKFTAAAAVVGGVCYAFKDKIKESDVYKDNNMDEKINKVKSTIKEKMPKVFDSEKDYVEEDELFFDDLDLTAEDPDRDYVSLKTEPASTPEVEDNPEAEVAENDDSIDAEEDIPDDENDVPTIEI